MDVFGTVSGKEPVRMDPFPSEGAHCFLPLNPTDWVQGHGAQMSTGQVWARRGSGQASKGGKVLQLPFHFIDGSAPTRDFPSSFASFCSATNKTTRELCYLQSLSEGETSERTGPGLILAPCATTTRSSQPVLACSCRFNLMHQPSPKCTICPDGTGNGGKHPMG